MAAVIERPPGQRGGVESAFGEEVSAALRGGFGRADDARVRALEKAIASLRGEPEFFHDLALAYSKDYASSDTRSHTHPNVRRDTEFTHLIRVFLGIKPAAEVFDCDNLEEAKLHVPMLERLGALNPNFRFELGEYSRFELAGSGSAAPGAVVKGPAFHFLLANELPVYDVRKSLSDAGRPAEGDILELLKTAGNSGDHYAMGILLGFGSSNSKLYDLMEREGGGVSALALVEFVARDRPIPEELLFVPDMKLLDYDDPEILAIGRISKLALSELGPDFARDIGTEGRKFFKGLELDEEDAPVVTRLARERGLDLFDEKGNLSDDKGCAAWDAAFVLVPKPRVEAGGPEMPYGDLDEFLTPEFRSFFGRK